MADSSSGNDVATMQALISTIKALSTKLDALERKIAEPELQVDNLLHLPTTIKLDVPRFNGEDLLGWIFKVNQFFYYCQHPISFGLFFFIFILFFFTLFLVLF